MKVKIFVFSIYMLSALLTYAQDQNFYEIQNFKKAWYTYDEAEKRFIPVINKNEIGTKAHTFFVDAKKYKPFFLVVKQHNADGIMLINGTFYAKLQAEKEYILPVKNLLSISNEVAVTVFGSSDIVDKSAFIGSKMKSAMISEVNRKDLLNQKNMEKAPFKNEAIIILNCLLVFVAILSGINSKAFSEYFSLKELMMTKVRDFSFLVNKPLNRVNVGYSFFLSLLVSLWIILFASHKVYLFQNPLRLRLDSPAYLYLLFFGGSTLAIFMLNILKYYFLNFAANLFGISKLAKLHYFKNIQFSIFTFIVLVTLSFCVKSFSKEIQESILHFILILALIAYVLRVVLAYFTILQSSKTQVLYIISYLCIVEIIPLLVISQLVI